MRTNKLKGVVLLFAAVGVVTVEANWSVARAASAGQQEPQTDKAKPATTHRADPADSRAKPADAELHVIGVYTAANSRGNEAGQVDVEVRPTAKPVVLALTSYMSVDWRIKLADGARIKRAIVSGYYPQAIEGLPKDVPVVNMSYYPADGSRRKDGWFYAYQADTIEYRKMVDKLNDTTGLLVSTFQGANSGEKFVIDGTRGRESAQKERNPRLARPKEPTSRVLLAASAEAQLHVVGVYQAEAGNGSPIDVDVKPTAKPVVLALSSYYSVLWKVHIAKGAKVKAIIVGGYYEQECQGIPADIPVVYRDYFPSRREDSFYAFETNTKEHQRAVDKLNAMTGLSVSTFQGTYSGNSFVVDGTRGADFAQKDGAVPGTKSPKKPPKSQEDTSADVADIPSQELLAEGDPNKRYFLIGPKKNVTAPADGYRLVVILPGGNGSAGFHPFVKRIYKNALSDEYLAVQPVAVMWTDDQQIVWPTHANRVAGMKFNTEQFVEAVIADVAKRHKVDRSKIFTLSWSSSGPAAYALSLQKASSVTGSFIAMSVFKPDNLPPLTDAKGRAYYLYHSPQDRVCPYRMAQQAKSSLEENGAYVEFVTYEGGHGWKGNVFGEIRKGVEWLEKNPSTTPKP